MAVEVDSAGKRGGHSMVEVVAERRKPEGGVIRKVVSSQSGRNPQSDREGGVLRAGSQAVFLVRPINHRFELRSLTHEEGGDSLGGVHLVTNDVRRSTPQDPTSIGIFPAARAASQWKKAPY